jgi:hypothetical protein
MAFWQLTINAHDPARLASFWAAALGYQSAPPSGTATWDAHYRRRLGAQEGFQDRLFDPEGLRPPLWFQHVPGAEAGKSALHLDVYATGRDDALPLEQRVRIVDALVDDLVAIGGTVDRRTRDDDPDDPFYYVVMRDPEGNEFCVA